jgi:hypothetical protein
MLASCADWSIMPNHISRSAANVSNWPNPNPRCTPSGRVSKISHCRHGRNRCLGPGGSQSGNRQTVHGLPRDVIKFNRKRPTAGGHLEPGGRDQSPLTMYVLKWKDFSSLETDFCPEAMELTVDSELQQEILHADHGCECIPQPIWRDLRQKRLSFCWTGPRRYYDNIIVERLWPPSSMRGVPGCLKRMLYGGDQPNPILL